MSKKDLSEQDIRTKYITPAIIASDWDLHTQIREDVTFTAGRIIVRGKLHSRGKAKRADYILYHKPNQPIAIVEDDLGDPEELLSEYKMLLVSVAETREALKRELIDALGGDK